MNQLWLLLILAGCFEVGMTTFLNLSDGLTKFPYRGLFLVCALISFLLLARVTSSQANSIPMGTAYAVWTGIGAAGTVIVGMLFFKEPFSVPRMLLLAGLIACVVGLQIIENGKGE